jgi:photosystem II stability/assembly factor-like uncharacterized protein
LESAELNNFEKNERRIMKTKTILFIIFIIFIQENCLSYFWEKIPGTDGGISSIIKGKGDTLLAGFDNYCNYLLISSNNGLSWNKLIIGDTDYHVLSLTINRKNGYLFAGTEDNGILRSTDDGISWERVAEDSIKSCVPTILADTIGNVYAVECFTYFWHSSDNGISWEKLFEDFTFPDLRYSSLKINQKGYFYAIFGRKLFCSKDKGFTWNWINNLQDSIYIMDFFIDKNDDIYAGGFYVNKSTDDGISWETLKIVDSLGYVNLINLENNEQLIVIMIHGNNIKIYVSNDKGICWKDVTEGINENVYLFSSIVLTNDGYYILGTYPDGIYRSSSKLLDVKSIDIEFVEFSISPNPADDYIELPEALLFNNSQVSIYSSIGVIVYQGNATKRIDISTLSPGIYFLKVKDKVYKFVKI